MTRLSTSSSGIISISTISSIGLALTVLACSSDPAPPQGGTGGSTSPGGATGNGGATPGAGGNTGLGMGGAVVGAGGATAKGGSTGTSSGGATPGAGGGPAAGTTSASGGATVGAGGATVGAGGSATGGGTPGGTTGSGGGAQTPTLPPLVTSAAGAYWKTDAMPMESTGAATLTVTDTVITNKWAGFGGSFNELGWKHLTSAEMQSQAMKLLFSATDGANLAWGRIPIGASDYGESRYTLADTTTGGTNNPEANGSNRPAADLELKSFSIARDEMKLIPFIKAAQAVKSDIRFWASPWTPPVWMKDGYIKTSRGSNAVKPSYFDGGSMKNDAAILASYAQYFKKFVEAYKGKGINVEVVSPQNEPGYDQNYPSCLWDKATYTTFIGKHLGPAMKELNVGVMLGTMSNNGDKSSDGVALKDMDITNAVLGDPTAKSFLTVGGAQWGVLGNVVNQNPASFGGLPVWATEHKCGNYPWNPEGFPTYAASAPNNHAYGVESWGYIRDAIKLGKVTSYSAWNMVLDAKGLGNDFARDWAQNALLVADGGQVKTTPFYHVFRHLSQYVQPGAAVITASGNDALAFKNPDNSLVVVVYNSGSAKSDYVVDMGGKKFQFNMPSNGWATLKYKP